MSKAATLPPIPCPDCSGEMHLQKKPHSWRGGSDWVYLCENYPQCRGLMSAHPNGKPLGKPADAYTRRARRMVHRIFDPLWLNAPERCARRRAYQWLALHMGIPEKECHISMMNIEQLRHAWRTIVKEKPTPKIIREWAKGKGENGC